MRALVIVLLATAFTAHAAEPAKPKAAAKPVATKAPAAPEAKPAPVPAGWKKVDEPDGGYSIVFPGEAELRALMSDTGEFLATIHMLEKENGDLSFISSHSDVAKDPATGTPAEVLRRARDGALQKTRGTLVNEKKIGLEGNPGLELVIATPGGMVSFSRVFYVDGRLYQLSAVMPKGHEALPDAKAFLESFRLLKKAP